MEIRTARLLLREFKHDDWQALHAYRSNPRYLIYYPQETASENEARAFVERMIELSLVEPRRSYQLAITLPENGQLIGNAGIRRRVLINQGSEAQQADIGYELDPQYWGAGYATEAARAMLSFGFGELGLHRIWAHCVADNSASIRVLEKLGMHLEARLQENEFYKDRWWDTLVYAILRQEWHSRVTTQEPALDSSQPDRHTQFRRAVPEDAPRLTQIAFAAKRYWGYPERWIAQWRYQLIITQDYIRSRHVTLAESEAGIVGFYGLAVSDHKAELDYLWVDPPSIGQGLGRALIEHACQIAADLGAVKMEIVADPNAEGFYHRMGAEKIGETVYELEGNQRRLPRMAIYFNQSGEE